MTKKKRGERSERGRDAFIGMCINALKRAEARVAEKKYREQGLKSLSKKELRALGDALIISQRPWGRRVGKKEDR